MEASLFSVAASVLPLACTFCARVRVAASSNRMRTRSRQSPTPNHTLFEIPPTIIFYYSGTPGNQKPRGDSFLENDPPGSKKKRRRVDGTRLKRWGGLPMGGGGGIRHSLDGLFIFTL